MTAELAMVGSQCRGERHEQVIARQRDALVELRAKMRVMESGHNPRTYMLSHIFIVVFHFIDHFRDEPGLTGFPLVFSSTCCGRAVGVNSGEMRSIGMCSQYFTWCVPIGPGYI